MITIMITAIITILLFGASIILFFWRGGFKDKEDKLVRRISFGIAIIGLYELSNVIYGLLNLNVTLYSYNKLIKLLGLLTIMFSIFKYVEVKER